MVSGEVRSIFAPVVNGNSISSADGDTKYKVTPPYHLHPTYDSPYSERTGGMQYVSRFNHSYISIVWPTFYVNNGHVTGRHPFFARHFNSFHKNEFIQRSRKTDGEIRASNTIICAVKF